MTSSQEPREAFQKIADSMYDFINAITGMDIDIEYVRPLYDADEIQRIKEYLSRVLKSASNEEIAKLGHEEALLNRPYQIFKEILDEANKSSQNKEDIFKP